MTTGWIMTHVASSLRESYVEVSIGRDADGSIWYYELTKEPVGTEEWFIYLEREYGERITPFYTSNWCEEGLGMLLDKFISSRKPGEFTLEEIKEIEDNFKMENQL